MIQHCRKHVSTAPTVGHISPFKKTPFIVKSVLVFMAMCLILDTHHYLRVASKSHLMYDHVTSDLTAYIEHPCCCLCFQFDPGHAVNSVEFNTLLMTDDCVSQISKNDKATFCACYYCP